uniref:DUF2303 family protein n=1 Tax=Sphingomonas sp. TaxID=28214 RepID=UPI0025E24AB1
WSTGVAATTLVLQNAISLIEYINRFKGDETMIFADIKSDSIVASIDYHKAPAEEKDVTKQAMHRQHTATLMLPKSEQWAIWTAQNEKLITHMGFSSFLEENSFDVVSLDGKGSSSGAPVGADLLELCRDLQVKQDVKFSSSIRMGDNASISYSKDADATTKDNMSLPVAFTISIPVYFGEAPVQIVCYTRRSISDGKLLLGYKMLRLEAIRQAEFGRVVNEVEGATQVPMVYGSTGR